MLKTLKNGCNSEIMLVQRGDLQVVLKSVESSAVRQVGHLLNEWSVLSGLSHENVVEVYRCMKKVAIPGK